MSMFDNLGRLWRKKKKPSRKDLATIQPHERTNYYPSVGLTPIKLAEILRQADFGDCVVQAELFQEMEEKDGHINGELTKRKNAVARELDWQIFPNSEDKKDIETADWIKKIFERYSIEELLFDLLDAIGKGYAACDLDWQWKDNCHYPERIRYIPTEKLTFIETVDYPQWINEYGIAEDIPPWRIIYHRHKAKSGHDTRSGILRVCAWMYLFKRFSIKEWMSYVEIYGIPFRLGRYSSGGAGTQHEKEKEDLLNAVRSLGSDGSGIISKNTEIELIQASSQSGSSDIFKNLCDMCNREISKAILGTAMSTENYDVGARASAEIGNIVRKDLVRGDAWALQETINKQLIRPLIGFNFGWDVPLPKFRFELQAPEDLVQLSAVYKNLVEMGQPISLEHVSERFSVPLPKTGERILGMKV